MPLLNAKPGHRSGLGLGLRREVRRVWGPAFIRIVKGFLRDAERLVGFGSDIPKDCQWIPKGRREVRMGMQSDVRRIPRGILLVPERFLKYHAYT